MTYAFYFDSSSCSGCKACQDACKDKNNLPLGVLWRRVYEVTGGEWTQTGEAWTNTIFSYNLSIACNHCVHPKCAGVCPVNAYEVRPDGIVLINTQICIGCGYCAWACPYDAPQIDKITGSMTKCNLCYDNLDAGLLPACVAACPMRCLDLLEISDQRIERMGLVLWQLPGEKHPFPLPKFSRTEPHLVIKPHPGLKQVGEGTNICNREETSPVQPKPTAKGEIPLLFFTLLAQMAIGAFCTIFMIYWSLGEQPGAWQVTFVPLLAVGAAIMGALLVSFFHLGTPKNAWRALNHLRKSWLSREILFTSGFVGLWTILTWQGIFQKGTLTSQTWLTGLTVVCGLAALFCMQRVYQLRSVPAWNSSRTILEFTLSTVVLGCLLTGTLLPQNAPADIKAWILLAVVLAFTAASLITIFNGNQEQISLRKWRAGLLLAGLLATVALSIWPTNSGLGVWFSILTIGLGEEAIGRWLFYARRSPGI
jgi:anaerobic dimethyl sulfoxide reductase subunit B (iron-sulfur subunit)